MPGRKGTWEGTPLRRAEGMSQAAPRVVGAREAKVLAGGRLSGGERAWGKGRRAAGKGGGAVVGSVSRRPCGVMNSPHTAQKRINNP